MKFELKFSPSNISEIASRYPYEYDWLVENEISPKARDRGYYTKPEFLKLCLWKTPRSRSRTIANPSSLVEEITGIAYSSNIEEIRLGVLRILNGVEMPTASVLLHFLHWDKYPILDYRALWSLGINQNRQSYSFDFWMDYVSYCRELAKEHHVSMRTLDRALWQYSKENQVYTAN